MPVIRYNDWFDEFSYLDEMARMHKLSPKLSVVELLWTEFKRIESDSDYRPELNDEGRKWTLVELSGQIVALSMELSDDLAAVCLSYLDTITRRDTRFIKRIANFRLGRGHRFYERASSDADYAAEASGLNPLLTSQSQKEEIRKRFVSIKEMRERFWKWYTGYKHGQSATPIVITATDSEGKSVQEWGLYLIPKRFKRDKTHPNQIHTQDLFINTVGNAAHFVNLARLSVALWTDVRNRQYPKVFHRTIP